MGGGYPTLEDFCAVYGLNLRFGFWMPFALMGCMETPTPQAITHIYMPFVCTGCMRGCQCFVLYNVRAYVYVRPNLNNS